MWLWLTKSAILIDVRVGISQINHSLRNLEYLGYLGHLGFGVFREFKVYGLGFLSPTPMRAVRLYLLVQERGFY